MLLALRNARKRYFLVSKGNSFGGLKIPYVMIDTGCNTTLVPIPEGAMDNIVDLFPCSSYKWTITGGGGVAALQSPVLSIERKDGAHIPVSLSSGFNEYDAKIQLLRLHVSYDDAVALKGLHASNKIFAFASTRLDEFIAVVDAIKRLKPDIRIGERRTHALLGQSVIGADGLALMQLGRLVIVCDIGSRHIYTDEVVTKFEDSSMEHMRKSFEHDGREFDDLEDDDHDEDHNMDISLVACDS